MWVDPSGYRWLNETWLKVDRGVNFYNTAAIPLDRGFLISRLILVALGLGAVGLSGRHFAKTLRGTASRRARRRADEAAQSPEMFASIPGPAPATAGLAGHDHQAAQLDCRRLAGRTG